MTPAGNARLAAGAAAVAAVALAVVQVRHGVLQLLDTGSYVSGAKALRAGHPFTTTLAPSFSNFSVLDVLAAADACRSSTSRSGTRWLPDRWRW